MRREGKPGNQTFPQYDQMPTEQLEEIIRADFWLSDDGTPDDERIDRMLEVIIQREKNINQQDAPQFKPWEEIAKEQPLAKIDSIAETAETSTTLRKKIRWSHMKRVSTIAAVFVCVFLLGTFSTAYALGIDVWGVLVRWTENSFHVEANIHGIDVNRFPEALRNMAEKLAAHGITEGVLPSYLPEGYEVMEENYFSNSEYSVFYTALSKDDAFLSINCTQYYTGNFSSEYEKDDPNPAVYYINGTSFYVFTNFGNPVIHWSKDNLDCSIIGAPEGEIEKIINSIQ